MKVTTFPASPLFNLCCFLATEEVSKISRWQGIILHGYFATPGNQPWTLRPRSKKTMLQTDLNGCWPFSSLRREVFGLVFFFFRAYFLEAKILWQLSWLLAFKAWIVFQKKKKKEQKAGLLGLAWSLNFTNPGSFIAVLSKSDVSQQLMRKLPAIKLNDCLQWLTSSGSQISSFCQPHIFLHNYIKERTIPFSSLNWFK